MLCGVAPSILLACDEIFPPLAGSTPVIRLNIVLLPAPFGPIRATISLAFTSNDTLLTATTPPNCLRASRTSSSAAGAVAGLLARRQRGGVRRDLLARRTLWKQRHQPRPEAARRDLQQQHQQAAEDDGLELRLHLEQRRQHALQNVLQDGDDARAEHRAPDVTGAADHRHEQILDAGIETERGRIHEQLEVRVEPAGQAGQHRGMDEDQKLHLRGRHAERFRRHMSAPQRAHGAAGARVEQVQRQHGRDDHGQPDDEIDRARIAELYANRSTSGGMPEMPSLRPSTSTLLKM